MSAAACKLTLGDRSTIRQALVIRQRELQSQLDTLDKMTSDVAYDRLRTQLNVELGQVGAVLSKVRP